MGVAQVLRSRSALRVNNKSTTSAATLTLRQSLWPLALVTILFFMWGFAYGLLDTLNKHFQNTLNITRTRSSGLQAAYFGAYPLASLGYANWILRHYGYKAVFIFGLTLYGIGALCMWPAGLNRSFGGFCAATFVIGSGLGSLETAANPYLAVCGPPKYAELRINLAQAFNGIGTCVAPTLASYVFFTDTQDDVSALKSVQWVYLAIGIFVFLLAGVFYLSNIPEVTDEDMAFQVAETHVDEQEKPLWKQYKLFHAALAQFTYTGAQAMLFVTMFFESVCFPTIVALGIRGLGRHYKRGSGFIVGGVCGGAVVPPLLGHVADMHNSTGFAMIVPTMFMVAAWTYAVAVNFVPAYRDTVDKVGDSQIGLTEGGGAGVMKDIEARGMEKSAEGSVQIEH
ncbi:hypothetical protein KXV45_005709 [Aspergillus fumigatus]|nr:hypothetical protein KXV45_005709 [Aspergillus fumigatus]KAH2095298.1 hypothetical protein KXW32_000167 [Aspergillus fumigatus]KAH2175705.1 hypothetical protein KXW37_009225 [Aspergillus fumigatus]KAH2205793.1 hypothetical protein KXV88_008000 [Aspergillus fumigatus]